MDTGKGVNKYVFLRKVYDKRKLERFVNQMFDTSEHCNLSCQNCRLCFEHERSAVCVCHCIVSKNGFLHVGAFVIQVRFYPTVYVSTMNSNWFVIFTEFKFIDACWKTCHVEIYTMPENCYAIKNHQLNNDLSSYIEHSVHTYVLHRNQSKHFSGSVLAQFTHIDVCQQFIRSCATL